MSRQGRVNTRRAKKIQSQNCLRKETVPFSERKLGMDGAKDRDKVIFECPNGSFSSIDPMFFWRNTLKLDVILGKSIFQILGAFVVQDVQIGRMTLTSEQQMRLFPGVANASSFAVLSSCLTFSTLNIKILNRCLMVGHDVIRFSIA